MGFSVKEGTKLWEPSEKTIRESNVYHYMKWLKENKQLQFSHYNELWEWSVTEIEDFWASLWTYFEIQSSTPYKNVLRNRQVHKATWFEGATINYAEHVFQNRQLDDFAIISKSEIRPLHYMTWKELYEKVASFATVLKEFGIKKGDRVVAYLPNIVEAPIALLACASIGAIWSSCSPDFGSASVIDRFSQIEPKLLITVDGYRYGGKDFDRFDQVKQIQEGIKTLEKTIIIPYLKENPPIHELSNIERWDDLIGKYKETTLLYERVAFDHPLWILYSSGTTGLPKAIVQGQGGMLLEHLKHVTFHTNLKRGDRFFWYTTTGWMMWNYLVGGLLAGATIILYDGSPVHPKETMLWEFAEETKMTVFGTSAPYLMNCKNKGISPKKEVNLEHLTCISSTGAPLPPEGFAWVYDDVKSDIWLASISGGTDVCSAFVNGVPTLPVHAGEIQCRALGAKVESFNEDGQSILNDVGELVLTEPLPSMPLYFWNDENDERYVSSYFDLFPNIWRHGDWIKITEKGSCQIYGRSDSTINRGGIRIGTSEIYRAVDRVDGIVDSLVIDLDHFMPLFVVLQKGVMLDQTLKEEIKKRIKEMCSPRHVPNAIYEVSDIPRTLNGKKLEVPVKKILMGMPIEKAVNKGSVSNETSLQYFIHFNDHMKKE